MVDVKFCGMTRPADARRAAELGANFVGMVFAESPRRVDADQARGIARAARDAGARAVGVFAGAAPAEVRQVTERADLDVVQLHGDARPDDVDRLRDVFDGEIWAVVRLDETGVPDGTGALFGAADGVLLDSRSTTRLGGTGVPFDWRRVAEDLAGLRRPEPGKGRLIVAGGLHAGNVTTAIAVLAPDVVDVSSGIESSPGVKDPERMRAFIDAVRGSTIVRQR